jgi:hypothetical protein
VARSIASTREKLSIRFKVGMSKCGGKPWIELFEAFGQNVPYHINFSVRSMLCYVCRSYKMLQWMLYHVTVFSDLKNVKIEDSNLVLACLLTAHILSCSLFLHLCTFHTSPPPSSRLSNHTIIPVTHLASQG